MATPALLVRLPLRVAVLSVLLLLSGPVFAKEEVDVGSFAAGVVGVLEVAAGGSVAVGGQLVGRFGGAGGATRLETKVSLTGL